jgi:hypothetical protein
MSTTETGAARYTGTCVHRVEGRRVLQGRGYQGIIAAVRAAAATG